MARQDIVKMLVCACLGSMMIVACGHSPKHQAEASIVLAHQVMERCQTAYGALVAQKLQLALAKLGTLSTSYARSLQAEFDGGRIHVEPYCSMTRNVFAELKKYHDFDQEFPFSEAEQYNLLRQGDPAFMATVERNFYGFQWDNRIFMASTQSNKDFFGTVAHEAQHVLREAHLQDYSKPEILCQEEFAAYKAEILVLRNRITQTEIASIYRTVANIYDLSSLRPNSCERLGR